MNNIKLGAQYADTTNEKDITHYIAQIRGIDGEWKYVEISREEAEKMWVLYSKEGQNMTLAAVANEFPQYSQESLKKIFGDLGVRKDTGALAPHILAEVTDPEERNELRVRLKVEYARKKDAQNALSVANRTIDKIRERCSALEETIKTLNGIDITRSITPIKITIPAVPTKQSLNIYLSDIHVGAIVPKNGLYSENKNYGEEEIKRRLSYVLNGVADLGHFDTINTILLGDSIDCAGSMYYTSRGHGLLDENMTPTEQVDVFVNIFTYFMTNLVSNNLANKYRIFAVPGGNHDGCYGELAHKYATNIVKQLCPDVDVTCWPEVIGSFEQDGLTFLCLHGKDSKNMKRALPDKIDSSIYEKVNEYVLDRKLSGDVFHIVKGDLHTETTSSSRRRFTYRNALSLFGASEYANTNYTRNSYGVSYDIIKNGRLIRGTFENML